MGADGSRREAGSGPPSTGRGPVGERLVRIGARIGAMRSLITILAVGVGLAGLLAFAASRVYDAVTESDGVAALDVPALHSAMQLRSPPVDGIAAMIAVVFGPVGMPVIAVVACVVLALTRRSWTPIVLTVGAGLGSLAMTIAGKDIIDRHRPDLADAIPPYEYSASFPSGHTLNATAVCGILAYLLIIGIRGTVPRVLIAAGTAALALVVGLSRVLLGAHWLSDVLAGWLLGAAWLAAVIAAHRAFLAIRERRRRSGEAPA